MELIRLGLQFFAEGGGNAGAAAAAPAATGSKEGAAPAPAGENQASPPDAKEPDLDRQFSDGIKGKFKDQFNRAVSDIVQKRLKTAKAENERLAKAKADHDAFLNELYDEFGADDPESLRAKLKENRSRMIEDESLRSGKSTEEVKERMDEDAEKRRIARENRQLKAEREEAKKAEAGKRILEGWRREAEEAKMAEKYPGFDLDRELAENDAFGDLLAYSKGRVSVEQAYVSTHFEDVIHQVFAQASNQGAAAAAYRFADNASRPVEGGIQKTAPEAGVIRPENMTKAQRQEIIKRVQRGETISF